MTDLDRILSALADPTRRGVIELLRKKPRRAGELASSFDMSAPAMSRHLRVLRLAFHIDLAKIPMDRLGRIAAKIRARNPNLVLRPVRRKTVTQDIAKVKEVYNAAWEANWGFVPMTDAEMDFLAARLKPLLMEGLIWLAEAGTEPVGFLLALPDYNSALQPLMGRLLTPKVLGFIPYLLGWKYPPRTRVLTLGMKEKYRSKGLESALLIEGLKVGIAAGVRESEASWILEDNLMMCRVLEAIGGRPYKRYRIYEKAV